MALSLNGTSGISGIDGSAATPAIQGSDTNTGISFGTDTVNINTGGTTRATVDSSGRLGIGTSSPGQALDVAGIVRTLNDSPGNGFIVKRTGGVNANGGIDFVGSDDVADASIKMATDVANALTLHTAGSERLRVTSAGLVGIGVTSPGTQLHVNSGGTSTGARIESSSSGAYLNFANSSGNGVYVGANTSAFYVETGSSERLRVDSSGRLLVGTSSSSHPAKFITQGNATGGNFASMAIAYNSAASAVSAGTTLGEIDFTDQSAGGVFARIRCAGDGTGGTNDYPGRLEFSTTADGASSPTERMRIANNGAISTVVPGGSTLYPAYDCRAWVNFNGTGTVSIRGSGNVSSITDNGPGNYTLNFSAGMPDANYSVTGTSSWDTTGGEAVAIVGPTINGQFNTSGVRVSTRNPNNSGAFDASIISVAIFR